MFLNKLARVIYEEGTASENLPVTVRVYREPECILWKGAAKDLHNQRSLDSWIVVEILVDKTDGRSDSVPDWNRGKIITVQ